MVAAIERAKTFERRRCGHLMDQDALPERECMLSVVDPKGKGENKFRYIVVTQDEDLVRLFFLFFFSWFTVLGCFVLWSDLKTDTWGCSGTGYGRWCLRRSCM